MPRKTIIYEGVRRDNIISHIENLFDYKFKNIELLLAAYRENDTLGQRLLIYGKNIFNGWCYKKNEEIRAIDYFKPLITKKDEIKLATLVDVYGIERLFVNGNPEPSVREKIAIFYKLIGAIAVDSEWDYSILNYVLKLIMPNLAEDDIKELAWLRTFVIKHGKGMIFENYINDKYSNIEIEGIDFQTPFENIDFCSRYSKGNFYLKRLEYSNMMRDYLLKEGYITQNECVADSRELRMNDSVYIQDDILEILKK